MSIVKLFSRIAIAAVVVVMWTDNSTYAADASPTPPPAVAAAPVSVGEPGCATCQHGAAAGSCTKCGKLFTHRSKHEMYPVSLCPGACFGYFQTQWRKWDEVCPYPYTGIGVSDAPRQPGTVVPPKPGELAPPRPLDPKMADPKKVGSDIPPIPMPMGKFGP